MEAFKRFHEAVLNNNAEVAKKLIDDGLDPNGTLEVCRCPNSCDGYTLLYMACVHDRMTIVQILLEAGADPDRRNRNDGIINVNTPFVFVIKKRNHDLLRVLMCESKVRADLPYSCDRFTSWRVPYGLFCQFHENEDVIKVLLGGECVALGVCNPVYHSGNLIKLLHGAAKHRCSEVCRVLLDHCGVEALVDIILEHDTETDVMSYLIEVYGAREFVEEEEQLNEIMRYGTTDMLDMLMGYFYKLYRDNKEQWREQMVTSWACKYHDPPCVSYMHSVMEKSFAFIYDGKASFNCLLRWGVYSVQPDPHIHSVFFVLAKSGKIESVSVLISLYPQSLQDEWLRVGSKPWTGFVMPSEKQEVDEYFATLVEKRRHVPALKILCRSVIFHNLGINPIPKAERLPLPRALKDFVQCKELFETEDKKQ